MCYGALGCAGECLVAMVSVEADLVVRWCWEGFRLVRINTAELAGFLCDRVSLVTMPLDVCSLCERAMLGGSASAVSTVGVDSMSSTSSEGAGAPLSAIGAILLRLDLPRRG